MKRRVIQALFSLSLALSWSGYANQPVDAQTENEARITAQKMCGDLVAGLTATLTEFLVTYRDEYEQMKARVMKHSGLTEKAFDRVFVRLANTLLVFEDRLLLSHEIDGKHAYNSYLLGVCLWAENYRDLLFAIDIFYRQPPLFEVSGQKPQEDLALEYFAARMVWAAEMYSGQNRRSAVNALVDFDNLAAAKLGIHWDNVKGQVSVSTSDATTCQYIQDTFQIRVAREPVTPLGLRFNNGRRFIETRAVLEADIWAMQQIQKQEPKEHLLGWGDQSTRQFFRIYRTIEGRVNRLPFASDFLSVTKTEYGQWGAIIRELKFAGSGTPTVDVSHALDQLESSWLALQDRYQGRLPVFGLELVVPSRASKLNGELGNDYSIGKTVPGFPKADVRELLQDGNPVAIEVDGVELPVYVRQLAISDGRWHAITTRDRQKRLQEDE